MNVGDLLGSGTISGKDATSRGALLEATENGKTPLKLDDGDARTFLSDGDEITLKGWCTGEEGALVGFGDCTGRIEPALDLSF